VSSVTVVLPTFRRPNGLARVLGALAEQQDPGVPWDVVVVDNDQRPGAAAVFAAHEHDLPVPASIVHEPTPGATRARNSGVALASGDVIAFVDDDVVPDRAWLARLVAPIVSGRADAAGGRVALDPSVPLPSWLGPDWIGYLSLYERGPDERVLASDDYVLTANAAFRAERIRAIGGFDEVLGPRAGSPMVNDDLDLCHRLAAAGGSIVYVPDAVVVHDVPADRLTVRYLLRRAYAQGRSDWLLDRVRNSQRPLGGAQGILVHAGRLLRDRWHEGLWHPDVAMSAALTVSHMLGVLREGSTNVWRRRVAP
jgi:glycosyltransferase involved in cell wall biosynthesis